MDTENKIVELDDHVNSIQEEERSKLAEDQDFKDLVYERMRKIHSEGMIVGFQTACHTALDKIYSFERKPGSKSANDYKRCLKDLKKFFEIGISRKVNTDEATESEKNIEAETAQN